MPGALLDTAENTALVSLSRSSGAPPPLALSDGMIAIRQFEAGDLPALYEATAESVTELCTWMNWCRPDYSLQDCRRFLADAAIAWELGSEFNFAIVDSEQPLLYGSIALNRIERTQDSANVGYWVRRTQSGRGIASRALSLVSRFAFGGLALERLDIIVPEGNIASRRVAEKAGARADGMHGRQLLLHGQPCKANMYLLELGRPDRAL